MADKKRHPKFNVPNFGAKSMKRVKARWRKQQGIDNKKRIDKQGYGATPKIGYKNSKEVRFARPEGKWEVLVHNSAELLSIQKSADKIAVFAHDLSKRKRAELQKLANSNGILVLNKVK